MQLGQGNILPANGAPETGANDALLFGKNGITLGDAWDIINPLEHIPFVSTLYDAMTGSTPKAGSQLIGGALYGGPVGVFASAVNLAFHDETGHDIVGSVVAGITGDVPNTQQLADTTTSVPEVQVIASKADDETAAIAAPDIDAITQTPLAEILPPTKSAKPVITSPKQAQDVLSLFDAPASAAQRSYRKAQVLAYPTAPAPTRDLVM